MVNNKLAIIGGSGLYDVEEFKNRELIDLKTPWGKPSDKILKTKFLKKEVFFVSKFFEEDINIASIVFEKFFSIRQFI